jgi:hypothetical protein
VFTGVKPCARTVEDAAASPSTLDGCCVNAGSVAVRVVEARVPPLGLVVVVVELVVGEAVGTLALLVAGTLALLAAFDPDPQAESASAQIAGAINPRRRIR